MQSLRMLRGVKTLRLCFELSQGLCTFNSDTLQEHEEQKAEAKRDFKRKTDVFLRLRVLPLKHATVDIYEGHFDPPNDEITPVRWTAAEKLKAAEAFCTHLMDPRGSELAKANEIAIIARRLRLRVSSAAYEMQYTEKQADRRYMKLNAVREAACKLSERAEKAGEKVSLAEDKNQHPSEEVLQKAISLDSQASDKRALIPEFEDALQVGIQKAEAAVKKYERAKTRFDDFMTKNDLTEEIIAEPNPWNEYDNDNNSFDEEDSGDDEDTA